jgi:hypothetical protein
MLRKENDRAGTGEGGFKSYLPPMQVGGFIRVRKKTGGGLAGNPPRILGPVINDGSGTTTAPGLPNRYKPGPAPLLLKNIIWSTFIH